MALIPRQQRNKSPEWTYFKGAFCLCFQDAPISGNEAMGELIGDVVDRCCPPEWTACKHIRVEDNRDASFKVFPMVMYCRIPALQAADMSDADVRKQLQQALDETIDCLKTEVLPSEEMGRLLESPCGVMLGTVTRAKEADRWYEYHLEAELEEIGESKEPEESAVQSHNSATTNQQ